MASLDLSLCASHRCIAPDHIGFGLSDRPAGFPWAPQADAENLDEFGNRRLPEHFTLIVHDYGGPIALPLCLRYPQRVQRVVLINTWMWRFTDNRDIKWKG